MVNVFISVSDGGRVTGEITTSLNKSRHPVRPGENSTVFQARFGLWLARSRVSKYGKHKPLVERTHYPAGFALITSKGNLSIIKQ